jgi:hypothetical protein
MSHAGEAAPRVEAALEGVLEVALDALVELAIDWWRFDRWLAAHAGHEAATSLARLLTRRWSKFLNEREVTVHDVTGLRYEAGLAVEVLDALTDDSLERGVEIVDETVAPIVMWRGALARHGQVVIRRRGA